MPTLALIAVLIAAALHAVKYAMRIAPVSHVAPARELGTLAATYLSSRVLREAVSLPRVLGAACIVGGIVCLAAARY